MLSFLISESSPSFGIKFERLWNTLSHFPLLPHTPSQLCKKGCFPGYFIHGQNWNYCSCDDWICSHNISSPRAGRKPRQASTLLCVYLDQTWVLDQLSFTLAVLSSLELILLDCGPEIRPLLYNLMTQKKKKNV